MRWPSLTSLHIDGIDPIRRVPALSSRWIPECAHRATLGYQDNDALEIGEDKAGDDGVHDPTELFGVPDAQYQEANGDLDHADQDEEYDLVVPAEHVDFADLLSCEVFLMASFAMFNADKAQCRENDGQKSADGDSVVISAQ